MHDMSWAVLCITYLFCTLTDVWTIRLSWEPRPCTWLVRRATYMWWSIWWRTVELMCISELRMAWHLCMLLLTWVTILLLSGWWVLSHRSLGTFRNPCIPCLFSSIFNLFKIVADFNSLHIFFFQGNPRLDMSWNIYDLCEVEIFFRNVVFPWFHTDCQSSLTENKLCLV